jgi:hypothetical protein
MLSIIRLIETGIIILVALTYLLRSHVQKCGYQFIPDFERLGVLDTPRTKEIPVTIEIFEIKKRILESTKDKR